MSSINYADIREEYKKGSLDISDTAENPISQFQLWFKEAQQAKVIEANAMCLSTVDYNNQPDGRIVLLKDVTDRGFTFFTNYNSQKGQELANQPKAALTFFWPELERQVRVRGIVQQIEPENSTEYFHSRPRESQIGAWVSPQSEVIEGRSTLEIRQKEYEERFAEQEIPRPQHWGGYQLVATEIEFWQGRASRLHDRILYQQAANGNWKRVRLAP